MLYYNSVRTAIYNTTKNSLGKQTLASWPKGNSTQLVTRISVGFVLTIYKRQVY